MRIVMAIAIVCSKCGQALQVEEDNSPREIECLWCGARCPVPGRAKMAQKPAPAVPINLEIKPKTQPPPLPPEEPPEEPPPGGKWYEQAPYAFKDNLPSPAPKTPELVPEPTFVPKRPTVSFSDEDDGQPYDVDGRDRPCPGCGRFIPAESVVCTSCGFDLKKGAKVAKTFEPVQRTWEAGWSFDRRRMIFIIGEVTTLSLGIIGSISLGAPLLFFLPWLLFTLLTVYLLGTWDRIDLTRNKKGRVVLKQTWRFFFLARPTKTIPLGDYEGVSSGKWRDPDFWDWMITLFGLFMGIGPGVLWWYFFIHKEMFYVALTKDHGHPELFLYRGWKEWYMKDMADAVRKVAFPTII
jgi:hypothetical protein